ncbi:MAG: hypothetical protein WCO90_11965 [Planctomycetota bacterium]|mgnify:CR=1 FL=1|jgi:hypothetical protein
MALVSLLTPEGDSEMEYQRKRYGYGTEIYLNSEQCEALGLTKMSAGQSVMVRATGVVARSTEELDPSADSGGTDCSVCIQLTEIEVKTQGDNNAAAAATMLYGGAE